MSERRQWNKERWDEEAKRRGFATARTMLITLHLFRSYSLISIARLLGCSRWTVTRLMHDLSVPIGRHVGQPLAVEEQKQWRETVALSPEQTGLRPRSPAAGTW
jgi:AraC-like DNA-binding protein